MFFEKLFGYILFLLFCNFLFLVLFLFLVTIRLLVLFLILLLFPPALNILPFNIISFETIFKLVLFPPPGYPPKICLPIFLPNPLHFPFFLNITMFLVYLYLLLNFFYFFLYFFFFYSTHHPAGGVLDHRSLGQDVTIT